MTDEIIRQLPELPEFRLGIAHLFLQHTSAALAINENADETVRGDMAAYFDRVVPENEPYFRHVTEGPDDMPAHIKSALIGSAISIPIASGRLALGTWQGIWLAEFRNDGGARQLIATLQGD